MSLKLIVNTPANFDAELITTLKIFLVKVSAKVWDSFQKRHILEETGELEPRKSVLEDDLETDDEEDEEEDDDEEEEEDGEDRSPVKSRSHREGENHCCKFIVGNGWIFIEKAAEIIVIESLSSRI
jgi:hypothetical protein